MVVVRREEHIYFLNQLTDPSSSPLLFLLAPVAEAKRGFTLEVDDGLEGPAFAPESKLKVTLITKRNKKIGPCSDKLYKTYFLIIICPVSESTAIDFRCMDVKSYMRHANLEQRTLQFRDTRSYSQAIFKQRYY